VTFLKKKRQARSVNVGFWHWVDGGGRLLPAAGVVVLSSVLTVPGSG